MLMSMSITSSSDETELEQQGFSVMPIFEDNGIEDEDFDWFEVKKRTSNTVYLLAHVYGEDSADDFYIVEAADRQTYESGKQHETVTLLEEGDLAQATQVILQHESNAETAKPYKVKRRVKYRKLKTADILKRKRNLRKTKAKRKNYAKRYARQNRVKILRRTLKRINSKVKLKPRKKGFTRSISRAELDMKFKLTKSGIEEIAAKRKIKKNFQYRKMEAIIIKAMLDGLEAMGYNFDPDDIEYDVGVFIRQQINDNTSPMNTNNDDARGNLGPRKIKKKLKPSRMY